MLSLTLRVEVAAARRPVELKRRCGIERNDAIIWAATADRAVCEHRWWRVQLHCSPIRARRNDISRHRSRRQARVRGKIVTSNSVRYQRLEVSLPRDLVKDVVAPRKPTRAKRSAVWRSSRIPEKNLDRDRIAKQRLV